MRALILCLLFASPALASEDRLTDNGDGTLTDTRTGLIWTQEDNGRDINWKDAAAHCDKLETGGYEDWRLATIDELAELFEPKVTEPRTYIYKGEKYPLKIDPRFRLTSAGVWSSTERYAGLDIAWTFFFSSGRRLASRGTFSNYQRALCVRGGGGD